MSRKPPAFRVPRTEHVTRSYGPYMAWVADVYDGDSGWFWTDPGLDDYGYIALRVRSIDAPEIRSKDPVVKMRGYEALAYAMDLLPAGLPVLITTYKNDQKSFERYVADVTLPDGTDFATLMVASGNADWSTW